ncbi:MAG: proline dehydrogenase family protein [Candidatus Doudnabacteria bacterium]|nr:proline dehydrogenase family protein [Candidatus Doudnabacteria bacterium]
MKILTNLDKAAEVSGKINRKGIAVSLSYLPVISTTEQEVERNRQIYFQVLNKIQKENLNSDVTLKLHQFGVYKTMAWAKQAIRSIVEEAERLGNFVWLDMERKITVEATIEIFDDIYDKHKNIGICLQAYLDRTEADMKYLLQRRVAMRLVKGFYKPSDFKDWSRVTENYSRLMEILLEQSDRPCIATHDLILVEKAKKIIRDRNLKHAELQFFRGVRDKQAERLVKENFKVRLYVPFGNFFKFFLKGLSTFDNYHHLQRLLGFKKLI